MSVTSKCGTNTGYHAHWRAGTRACEPCRAAHATHEQVRKTGSPKRRAPKPCGTAAAYERHRARGQMPCQPCVDAYRARKRRRPAETQTGGDLAWRAS